MPKDKEAIQSQSEEDLDWNPTEDDDSSVPSGEVAFPKAWLSFTRLSLLTEQLRDDCPQSLHNGPSTGNSPPEDSHLEMQPQVPQSEPKTASTVHPQVTSPRISHNGMYKELVDDDLHKNLLLDWQAANATYNAGQKRHETFRVARNEIEEPQGYHQKGW
ncbi:uncharacterized protein BDZ99DRAFT_153131 [Mytilinidion resinicola]|uniref:DUF3295 domain-containing protein n=1 Tax=Mytilinidion resinicola TaxID=574789 RepID=A0A6A6Y6Q0_9PEZI|nr:uncharacterized protein BDZ99DRAFT_153131 [Mytilinidion resinicola]KAF2804482.1 hypothetical protein BDZ99DRAFT_153131 [Mytilinidion resinicola]